MNFCVDYGHCLKGADTGASGNGRREENCTREIGRLVTSKLRSKGHTVIETNIDSASSVNDSLNKRKNIINSSGCHVSVSIHLNSGGGTGVEVFTYRGENVAGASVICREISTTFNMKNRGVKASPGLAMVDGVTPTAMLIECCFIDSASDMSKYNPEKFANCIVKGLIGQSAEESGWVQDNVGWWYKNTDGTYPKNK